MLLARGVLLSQLCATWLAQTWLAQADRSDFMTSDVHADMMALARGDLTSEAERRSVELQYRNFLSENTSWRQKHLEAESSEMHTSPPPPKKMCTEDEVTLFIDKNGKLSRSKLGHMKELDGEERLRACCSSENVKQAKIAKLRASEAHGEACARKGLKEFLECREYRSFVDQCYSDGSERWGCTCDESYVQHMMEFHGADDSWKDDGKHGIASQSLLDRFGDLKNLAKEFNAVLQSMDISELNSVANDAISKAKVAANTTHKYTKDLEGLQHGGKMFVKRLTDYHRGNNINIFQALNDGSLGALDDSYKRYIKRHGQGDAEFTAFKTNLEAMGHRVGRSHLESNLSSGSQWYDEHGTLLQLLDSLPLIFSTDTRTSFKNDIKHLVEKCQEVADMQNDETCKLEKRVEEFSAKFGSIEEDLKGRDVDPMVGDALRGIDQSKKELLRWLFEKENRYLHDYVQDFDRAKKVYPWFQAMGYMPDLEVVHEELNHLVMFQDIDPEKRKRYEYMRQQWDVIVKTPFLNYANFGYKEERAIKLQVDDHGIAWNYLELALLQIIRMLPVQEPKCRVDYKDWNPSKKEYACYEHTRSGEEMLSEACLGDDRSSIQRELSAVTHSLGSTWNVVSKRDSVHDIFERLEDYMLTCDPRDPELQLFKENIKLLKQEYIRYLFEYESKELHDAVEKYFGADALALFSTIEYRSVAKTETGNYDVTNLLDFPVFSDSVFTRENPTFVDRYTVMRDAWQESVQIPYKNFVKMPSRTVEKGTKLWIVQLLMNLPLTLDTREVQQVRLALYELAVGELSLAETYLQSGEEFAKLTKHANLVNVGGDPVVQEYEDDIILVKQEYDRFLRQREHDKLRAEVIAVRNPLLTESFDQLEREKDIENVKSLLDASPLNESVKERYLALRKVSEPRIEDDEKLRCHRILATLPTKYDFVAVQDAKRKLFGIAIADEEVDEGKVVADASEKLKTQIEESNKVFNSLQRKFDSKDVPDIRRGKDQIELVRKEYRVWLFQHENRALHDELKKVGRQAHAVFQEFEGNPRNVIDLVDKDDSYPQYENVPEGFAERYLYMRRNWGEDDPVTTTKGVVKRSLLRGDGSRYLKEYSKYRTLINEEVDDTKPLGVLRILMKLPKPDDDRPEDNDETREANQAKRVLVKEERYHLYYTAIGTEDRVPRELQYKVEAANAAFARLENGGVTVPAQVKKDYMKWIFNLENKALYEKVRGFSNGSFLTGYETLANQKDLHHLQTPLWGLQERINEAGGRPECQVFQRYLYLRNGWGETMGKEFANYEPASM